MTKHLLGKSKNSLIRRLLPILIIQTLPDNSPTFTRHVIEDAYVGIIFREYTPKISRPANYRSILIRVAIASMMQGTYQQSSSTY